MEVWKDIKGFEGIYQVSNLGRVKSVSRKTIRRGIEMNVFEKIISQQLSDRGYYSIVLKNQKKYIHRLVAEAFILKNNEKHFVNHKDGNKLNNNSKNLEWCTHSENIKHAYNSGLINRESVKKEIVMLNYETGEFVKKYNSIQECADDLKTNHDCISRVLRKVRKKHLGYSFIYG